MLIAWDFRLTLDHKTKAFPSEWDFGVEFEFSSKWGVAKVLLDQLRNEIRGKRNSIRNEQE